MIRDLREEQQEAINSHRWVTVVDSEIVIIDPDLPPLSATCEACGIRDTDPKALEPCRARQDGT